MVAIQKERLTRQKHQFSFGLHDELPVRYCLDAAGVHLADLDFICSSFQGAGPCGEGLGHHLIAERFSLFDPFDPRHYVISHHLAHAYHAFGTSGWASAAVLIADLAGSATADGLDFALPFREWFKIVTERVSPVPLRSENFSIYVGRENGLSSVEKGHTLPHIASDVMVQSVASLYENVSRFVFGGGDAYGQLMALASLGSPNSGVSEDDLVQESPSSLPVFRNDWQTRFRRSSDPIEHADLARATQRATESALLSYAEKAKESTGLNTLAVAGGVFMNIPSNSAIADSGLFEGYHVPSAPNDAGISIGCAIYAESKLAGRHFPFSTVQSSDRFGRIYRDDEQASAVHQYRDFLDVLDENASAPRLAKLLLNGAVLARWHGASEFGPRALGGRSFLASPLLESSKQRLNGIKGRQSWRPVAPVVRSADFMRLLTGPCQSHYMSYTHRLRPPFTETLKALFHPDLTTRAQILEPGWDDALWELLGEFGALSGVPILVNTSLNTRGEPICEKPEDAIRLFIRSPDVDYLLLQNRLITRSTKFLTNENLSMRLAPSAKLSTDFQFGQMKFKVHSKTDVHQLSDAEYSFLLTARAWTQLKDIGIGEMLSADLIMKFVGLGVIECRD